MPVPRNDFAANVSKAFGFKPDLDPYANGLHPKVEEQLTKRYVDLFNLYSKHADKIERVTTWGVGDAHSWRNYWPINGRTDYPLIIDREMLPKPTVHTQLIKD